MTTRVSDWNGSVLVRVYPRPNARPADLKILGAALAGWLKTGPRRAGFRRAQYTRDQLAALQAGELPLPEVLAIANAFRHSRRRIKDPNIRAAAERLRHLPLSGWLECFAEGTRRILAFRVFGVGSRGSDLFESLRGALHAPAIARIEFLWEVLEGLDRISERGHVWEVCNHG